MEFEEIYRKYFHDVYLYSLTVSNNHSVAEEITQETFFKAIKSINSYDGSKDIKAWLFTIAKNSFYTYCRKRKKIVDFEITEEMVEPIEGFTEKIMNQEIAFEIHKYLHEMKEPYKEVFNLRIFGELSFEQIGKIFSKSAGWARVTFYRAKNMII